MTRKFAVELVELAGIVSPSRLRETISDHMKTWCIRYGYDFASDPKNGDFVEMIAKWAERRFHERQSA